MIPVEAHLALNHVPLVGMAFGLVFFLSGLMKGSGAALLAGLRVFVAMGITAFPVAGSGLLSASALANAPWLDANAVTHHQLAGIATLAVLVTLGGLSAAMLSSSRNASTLPRWGTTTVLVLALVGFGACVWTAYVGGRLRHSELRQARASLNPRPLVSEGKAECGTCGVTHVDLRLDGKRALVTGSTVGIGEPIARALAREGTALVVHGRDEECAMSCRRLWEAIDPIFKVNVIRVGRHR